MKNLLIVVSMLALLVFGILGRVDPSIPSFLKQGDDERSHPETPHFED
ncbi:MAG: hypothetical protein JXR76_26480 [Deltaproteobacteria bacterium]|nr:hypothetical protein [Deltaproteobacteria bacterium]